MGNWNTHGMTKDDDLVIDCLDGLGLFPEELVVLSDHAAQEAWMWEQMRKYESGQKKRKCTLIAGFWKRRARKWKELAAMAEHEYTEEMEERLG